MKLLIIRTNEELIWHSCKSISSNLQNAYLSMNEDVEIEWFDIPFDQFIHANPEPVKHIDHLARKIREFKPDRLIFIDHLPLPSSILSRLMAFLSARELPSILIHVYGDFTYFAKEWCSFFKNAQEMKFVFVTASLAQKKLVDYFLSDSATVVTAAFPVSDKTLFSSEKRQIFRTRHHLKENDTVVLYAGRVHLQKNVDLLIKEFAKFLTNSPKKNIFLYIAGPFDDSGAPIFGINTFDGHLYLKLTQLIQTLPSAVSANIKFLGHLNHEEFHQALSGSDLFASFSLFHDEDFGMAPAEALVSGIPSVLTDWGGYSSFLPKNQEWSCTLLPVAINELGHKINTQKFHLVLQDVITNGHDEAKRSLYGEVFHTQFSPANVANQIKDILVMEGQSFGENYWRLLHFSQLVAFQESNQSLNSNFLPSKNGYYAEVYSHYISGKVSNE